MSMIRILHAADLHLDSPFEGLSAAKAAIRRREQRELLRRIAELAAREHVDLVLLAGDLMDSDNTFYETGDELIKALRLIPAPVFISPGNHDYYSEKSAYYRLKLPENVHVFTENELKCLTSRQKGLRVWGAAFTEKNSSALLRGFHAEKTDGLTDIMVIHGDAGSRSSAYDPITEAEIAASGMDYIALGHIHKPSGLLKAGETWYSWPGCPEGRGFDETGDRFVNIIELEDGKCELRQVSVAARRYEILNVDVTGTEPLLAIHTMLPDDTTEDIYRIVLTGETETSPDIRRLYDNLIDLFFELQIKDETHIRSNIWEKVGEDTLRGLFLTKLKKLHEKADEDTRIKIEQAARWGLAALDNMEEVVRHEDQ